MTRNKVSDPERLNGELITQESLWSKYGFEITELNLRNDSEDIEDIKLRSFRHNMLLQNEENALVLRKHCDTFIHEVVKAGSGYASDALNVVFEVIEYNKSLSRCVVYVRSPCNYLNQRVPPMHSLDIAWSKYNENNSVNFFWDFRGENHMFCITKENMLSCVKNPDLVLGCNAKGELLLVQKGDITRRLVFKDLYGSITWRLEHRISSSSRRDIVGLKKQGFMTEWNEPGTMERKLAGREVCFEVMSKIIHELLSLGEGDSLLPGDAYFGSRIGRSSKHKVDLVEREDDGGCVTLTLSSDAFERCTFRLNPRNKYIQYIATQFYEVNLEISWPANLMFDISFDKPRNSHFIHHVLFVNFVAEADTAKDDPTLPVFFEEVIPAEEHLQMIRNFNTQHKTNFLEKAFFVKWIGKPEHAFDVKESKLVDNQEILLFYQHRGKNQQFCIDMNQQSLHPLEKLDLAWGCRDEALKLVPFRSSEMIRFSNLAKCVHNKKKLGGRRYREIASMSRSNWSGRAR